MEDIPFERLRKIPVSKLLQNVVGVVRLQCRTIYFPFQTMSDRNRSLCKKSIYSVQSRNRDNSTIVLDKVILTLSGEVGIPT